KMAPRAGELRRRRVPSEGPGRAADSGVAGPELADDFLRHQFGASGPAGDELLRDTLDLLDRREQPRVPRHAPHRVGVLIVHLAHQHPLAEGAERGRREHLRHRLQPARAHQRDVDEIGRAQAERAVDALAAEAVERDGGDALDGLAEQHEVEVGVERFARRRRLGLLAMDLLVHPLLGPVAGHEVDLATFLDLRNLLKERPPRREPRAMREHLAEGDVALVVDAEVVEEARHPVAQAQLVLAHQQHHRDRRRQGLGQRREVEDRLQPHRRAFGHQRAMAEGALEHDVGAAAHDQRRAGNHAALDRLGKRLLDLTPSHAGRPYPFTAGSRKLNVRARASTRARTPKGIVKLALPCPASIPASTGHLSLAARSATHSSIIRCSASLPAGGRSAPKTTAATRSNTPACSRCTSMRSILYAFSPVSSKNRTAPSSGGAYGVPIVAAIIDRHPPTTSPSALPARSAARAASVKPDTSPASKRRRWPSEAPVSPRAKSIATIGP